MTTSPIQSIDNRSLVNPLLSICIPTFNRASCLDNLLKNISNIVLQYGADIEICISNNNSSDNTAKVIQGWSNKFEIKHIKQKQNIGGTSNAIAVTNEATGRWLILIGDDDEFLVENFKNLIVYLKTASETDWIMVGVLDNTSGNNMLRDIPIGHHNAENFKKILLRTGLYKFGFIGMHIFPITVRKTFSNLTLEQAKPWAHLALLLRHLNQGQIQILTTPIVKQAAGGAELFWKSGDWMHVNLQKLNIIDAAKIEKNQNSYFFNRLIIKEIYSKVNINNIVAWKIREPKDFSTRAYREFVTRYKFAGYLIFLLIPHFVLLLSLIAVPDRLVLVALRLMNKMDLMDSYVAEKNLKKKFDGIERGT